MLTSWQVDNTGLQLNTPEQLRELPFPFIAHLRKNNGWYVLVTALQGNIISYIDDEEGRKTESLTDFEQKWSGVVLLAEATDQSGEAEYTFKRKQEVLQNLRAPFVLAGVLLVSWVVILNIAEDFTTSDWLLLLTKSIGLALSILLVNKQLGGKNALVDRLCQINAKTNCDDVLNSPAAKLWGFLSWTDVGLPKSRREHEELMRLRHDPNLFRALLMQQPKMPPGSADLRPIVLGNSEAEHTITMVTNPYCNPCAKTHKDLNELLWCNDNVKAAIIFVCDGVDGQATQFAIHVLALTKQGKAADALADWYEKPEKDFDSWAKRYPVTPSQIDWMVVANKQSDWCQTAHITATPTLFVDGYQQPEQYGLDRLRWLINSLESVPAKPQLSL